MKRRQEAVARHASEPAQKPWLPRRDTTVLLLSGSPQLQGEVGRVAAAAAVELIFGDELEQLAGSQRDIAAVLVDAGQGVVTTGWRGPVIVVGFPGESEQMWQQAARLEADRVAVLPDSAPWLADYFAGLQNPESAAGVLGVVGGCGGSGASTLSLLVAAEAASRGTRTLLVDGDRWGGGLAALVSGQEAPGLRWPELLQVSGSINPGQLAAALPHVGPLALLSWESGVAGESGTDAGGTARLANSYFSNQDLSASPATIFPDPISPGQISPGQNQRWWGKDLPANANTNHAVNEVMRAAQGVYGLVVVDLARTLESLGTFGPHCTGLVVVLPGRARAVTAAVQLGAALPALPVAAAVRGPMGEGLDAAMVATAAGLPLVGEMPWLRNVEQVLAAQRVPELLRRRRLRLLLAGILEWMAGDEPAMAQRRSGGRS